MTCPGLFVIQGVATCGLGEGYCLLSNSCLVDADFQPDLDGHCAGLRHAFTPVAEFVCCRFEPPPTMIVPDEEDSTSNNTDETTQQSSSEESHRDESSHNSQASVTSSSQGPVVVLS